MKKLVIRICLTLIIWPTSFVYANSKGTTGDDQLDKQIKELLSESLDMAGPDYSATILIDQPICSKELFDGQPIKGSDAPINYICYIKVDQKTLGVTKTVFYKKNVSSGRIEFLGI